VCAQLVCEAKMPLSKFEERLRAARGHVAAPQAEERPKVAESTIRNAKLFFESRSLDGDRRVMKTVDVLLQDLLMQELLKELDDAMVLESYSSLFHRSFASAPGRGDSFQFLALLIRRASRDDERGIVPHERAYSHY